MNGFDDLGGIASGQVSATDAAGKERVAGDEQFERGKVEADGALRVSGRVQYRGGVVLEADTAAVDQAAVGGSGFRGLDAQPGGLGFNHFEQRQVVFVEEDGRARQALEAERASHVVNVGVGDENLLEGEAKFSEAAMNAADLVAGVDDDGFAGLLVAEQGAVAGQHAYGKGFEDHGLIVEGFVRGGTGPQSADGVSAQLLSPGKKNSCDSLFIRYNACMAVTRRQKEVVDFLESFVARNGYSPSFEEIARGLGLKSLATVHKHITNLEKKGLLDRVHNRSRSIDLLPPGSRTRSSSKLPLAGRIAAGMPVEASETSETISLHDVVGNRDVFALEVRGDSMRDEHIINGDYVLVERTRTARQGEIVVALVHGSETTLKRFFPEGNVVRLQPANAEMEPIYVPAAQVAIQGRVLGVLRKYR